MFILSAFIVNGSLNSLVGNSMLIRDESMPFALLAEEMSKNIVEIQEALTDYSLSYNEERIKEVEETASEFKSDLSKFKDMFSRENDEANLKSVADIEAGLEAFIKTGKDMTDAYNTKGKDEGEKLMGSFDEKSNSLKEKMDVLLSSQTKEATEMAANIVELSSKSKTVLWGFIGLTLIVSIIIALYSRRRQRFI
ncbi:methyl-accepting chemotaxis sensory transducer [Candidatus Magnetoovum chiemensis]|nr:methyl-accepting chemotaxis sensory transducer [Candidatus Magnetoovum chiemensis]